MATVRKRTWHSGGDTRTAWVADYIDQDGKRHVKTFETKKDTDRWLVTARAEIRDGIHTPDSKSPTIGETADVWVKQAQADGLEPATVRQYIQHVERHVKPFLGATRLSKLTAPAVAAFANTLRDNGRSPAMVRKVLASLGAIVAEAHARGLVAQNVVYRSRHRRARREAKRDKRRVTVPTKAEIRALLEKASGRWRPFIVTAIFTGLRASELRGLTWANVDFEREVIQVRQRADAWGRIGPPKSEAGTRDVPMAPMVANTLKEWQKECPKGDLGLVFPNGYGNVENLGNIRQRGFDPLQVACGIVKPTPKGSAERDPRKPKAKYGLHALRHAAASLFIEHGFPPKRIQALMGHASIQMTFDVYGHLFPTEVEDRKAMKALQARLLGAPRDTIATKRSQSIDAQGLKTAS
jgi:integrase